MAAAQHELDETPVAESSPAVGQGVPNVESGVEGLGITTSGGGLRPPTPSSVEPSGMPTRPTCDPNPIPVGDEADDDGPAVGLLAVVVQVPDAFPVVPPPSKIVVEPELPVADIPEFKEVPGIELAMPEAACGIDPPILEQLVMLPGAGPNGDAPNVNGLTPGDESSVAPMGMPVRGTAGAGPMPRGDVIPNGDPRGDVPIPPTCAVAEPLAKTAAVSVANDRCVNLRRRVILMFPSSTVETAGRSRPSRAARRSPVPPFRQSTGALPPKIIDRNCSELTDVVPNGTYLVRHVTACSLPRGPHLRLR
jgi:hypothetical protein